MTLLMYHLPIANVLINWQQSNVPGKAIVFVLIVGSIWVWSMMLTKSKELKLARLQSERLLREFRDESHPVGLFLKKRRYDESPLYVMYEKVCSELGVALELNGAKSEDLFTSAGRSAARLSSAQLSRVRSLAEREVTDQVLIMEDRMGWVATATTTAPFLGLLGTVWGVMDSFGGMAVSGNAMLTAVAPGISGALLTTVIGLLVALPSAIGYNVLGDRIRRLTVQLDNFSQELISSIERHYQE